MGNLRSSLNDLPLPIRGLVVGAVVLGAVGAVAGLVIGLFAYPPTAVVAIFEIGVPAAVVGGLLGLVIGSLAHAASRVRERADS